MNKPANAFNINLAILEGNKRTYVSRHGRAKKGKLEYKLDSYKYNIYEYQKDPQSFFCRLEHWCLD